jgi:putative SOS response-associated peptidase YedK
VWQDYPAPIIVGGQLGERQVKLATYGMVPKRKIPEGVKKYTTMNARAETVGTLRSYSKAWKAAQLCLVPLRRFYEPNWETGKNVWWEIGMAEDAPFAVAGLWRLWDEPDGTVSHSFTQLTVNADDHPLMKHFHRPGAEKRSLVIVAPADYDDWLTCKDPERARAYLNLYPAHLMKGEPRPN